MDNFNFGTDQKYYLIATKIFFFPARRSGTPGTRCSFLLRLKKVEIVKKQVHIFKQSMEKIRLYATITLDPFVYIEFLTFLSV